MDHQLFALSKLDVTGDGREEVVACSWDGQTYIVNQEKQAVRFQFDHSVSAFCAGHFSLKSDPSCPSSPSLVYATFHNKIYVYYNVILPRITLSTLTELLEDNQELRKNPEYIKCSGQPMRELVAKALYEYRPVD